MDGYTTDGGVVSGLRKEKERGKGAKSSGGFGLLRRLGKWHLGAGPVN